MIVLAMIVLCIALLVWAFIEVALITEEGTPAEDSDILEMLEKYQAEYTVDKKWNDKFKLTTWKAPNIHQTQYSIIFPYYIDGVGVVPIWYKSADRLKTIFEEKISASKYKTTKRGKLGLE